jgi:Zn-dependent protease
MPAVPMNFALIVFELVVMVLSISLHDCAQAWAANRLGDPTARMLGRMTMNPARHFDLFGMVISPLLCIFVFTNSLLLGWGKPVPTTYRNFPRKNGEMLAVLAGPAAQVVTAIVCLIIMIVLKHANPAVPESLGIVAAMARLRLPLPTTGLTPLFPLLLLLYMGILMNLFLAVFNLVPIPFLDGGRILIHFLPYNAAQAFERYSLYIMIAFFFLGFPLVMMVFGPLLGIFNAMLALL